MAKELARFTHDIRRPIGLVLTRRGTVQEVLVGSGTGPSPATLGKFRASSRSLRGLRLIRSHLSDQPLSQEDLTTLALLRLDMVGALGVTDHGEPGLLSLAHLLPPNPEGQLCKLLKPTPVYGTTIQFNAFIQELEADLQKLGRGHDISHSRKTAILVSASPASRTEQEDRLEELAELATSAGVAVVERIVQRTQDGHQRYQVGSGKLKETLIHALQKGVDLLVFDQELSPAQIKAIAELTDMSVIDRTQLILDIFASRAHSREGKIQVELAQLRYRLPRLTGRGATLSRLGGGIGTRGPGETKLEADRRRIRDRISHLERELELFARHQGQRRAKRMRHAMPVISIVGYTNAGKSTLLNVLTDSHVRADDRVFETLDTTSRRLRFPHDREVIVTDTVGFIRDLPKDLLGAFRTTLEELRDADLLLHVVDAGARDLDEHMAAVDRVLGELGFDRIPRLLVFNKCDRLPAAEAELLCRRYGAIGISALEPQTLHPLLHRLERQLASRDDLPTPGHAAVDNAGALASRS
ncbi:GTPase HflX [Nitrospira sp. KM1]|uniref:GTPase HflX n=1 Tax=Nitrospira sp. KM1 TaxID=1936990 RepID=UPI0013A74F81|nr:GTPase HflX [Nitrospira sp. KM1]BCA53527.1 GTPase HflX [Nitrospira sp. KM1]